MKNTLIQIFATALISMLGTIGYCQEFPSKPIRLIVGYQPGGNADLVTRLLAKEVMETKKYQMVIENRSGAGGFIANEYVAKSPPDGYTLLLANSSFAYIPAMFSNPPFDTIKDYAPVALLASTATVLVVHPAVPAKNVKELIALARSQPGKLTYASGGTGGSTHLSTELFKSMTKTNILHIPYKGNGPSIADLVTGRVDISMPPIGAVINQIKSGRLRALATSGAQRAVALPNVPTISEAGVTGYEAGSWYGFVAPAKTPASIINTLSNDMLAAGKRPSFKNYLENVIGAELVTMGPAEFSKFIEAEVQKWGKVIKDAGITAK